MDPALRFFPDQASTIAPRVDALYFYLIGISTFFSLLIFVSVVYFAVKYRRRSEDEPPPPQMRDDLRLEITWIVVPLVLVMIAFFWGASVYYAMARPPQDALEIFVVGRQWMWKFQHPDGQREINELHVPLGRPVKLTLASEDVIVQTRIAGRIREGGISILDANTVQLTFGGVLNEALDVVIVG